MLRPTLRQTIGLLLCGTSLLIAAVISIQSYLSSRRTLLLLSQAMIQQHAELVREEVHDLFTSVDSLAHLTLAIGGPSLDAPEATSAAESYFYHLLAAHPNLSKINYGDPSGAFVMVARQPDGRLRAKRITSPDPGPRRSVWRDWGPTGPAPGSVPLPVPDDPFDPRVRPWYIGALAHPGLHWTDAYVFHSDRQIGVTAALARRDPDAQDPSRGRLRGVLSIDVSLLDLSRYLRQIRIGQSGHAFLVDQEGHLVAGSDLHAGTTNGQLSRAADSRQAEVAALAAQPAFGESLLPGAQARTLRFACASKDCVATLVPLPVGPQRRWIIGVVALEDEFLIDAKRTQMYNLLAAVALGLLGLLLGLLVARLIARSLERLVFETARVQKLELDAAATPRTATRFREVDEVLQAFEGMKTGLRAFQKYVPTHLVRALLSQQREPALGGEVRELTLFFSDIRGFSTISETLHPMDLAQKLGRYLSAVTDQIHAQHGTVDKYIGDAVMAFWGAPLPVAEHARRGCLAALRCQRVIHALSESDPQQPLFYTRIGVHTAEVVVGNFGSAERFNYTVIGDGVNVANRLEGLNQAFGTEILISESTYALVRDHFDTRRLSQVTVRGRERPVWVYELLGVSGETAAERLHAARRYEDALTLHLQGQDAEAATLLQALLQDHPADQAAQRLLQQCQTRAQAASSAAPADPPAC